MRGKGSMRSNGSSFTCIARVFSIERIPGYSGTKGMFCAGHKRLKLPVSHDQLCVQQAVGVLLSFGIGDLSCVYGDICIRT